MDSPTVVVFPAEVLLPDGHLLRRAKATLSGGRLVVLTEHDGVINIDVCASVGDVTGDWGPQLPNRAHRLHATIPGTGQVHVTGTAGCRCGALAAA